MRVQKQQVEDAVIGAGIVDSLDDMHLIHRPGMAAVIWRRQPLMEFQVWIDDLDPAVLPDARLILQPYTVREAVSHLCDQAGMPGGKHRDMFVDDVAALADGFAATMATPYLRLRLDVVNDNACRKFHMDAVTARLVCTYRGTGTQYGISSDGGDPKRVYTVPAGSPIILRGTRWPDAPPSGLLHRSPPIEGTGETRLVLVLDPVCDPETAV